MVLRFHRWRIVASAHSEQADAARRSRRDRQARVRDVPDGCAVVARVRGDRLHPGRPDDSPPECRPIHDADLSVSWHHEIETVPTLIRIVDGEEVERTVGWLRSDWQRITGIDTLGDDLPLMRPGCGSMSVDPNLVDGLRAKFSGSAAAIPSNRAGRARRRDGGALRSRRRPTACRWCHRPKNVCCGCWKARRARRTRSSPSSRPISSRSRSRRSRSTR